MLDAPIVPTLLRLAAPNVVVVAVQAAVATVEVYFVGWLGSEALAGVSLVFPLIMLMQTMSAGGMGGGVASAVARAVGGGRREEASALVLHAVVIALGFGAAFTLAALTAGPWLYHAMGGTGNALAAAVAYSSIVFGGALAVWMFNTLASVIRGTGHMMLPATVVVAGAVLTLVLSPALILGWASLPALGVAGAGIAFVTYYVLGSLVFLAFLLSRRGLVRLTPARLRWRLFADILRVGAPGALNTVQTNLTVALLTAIVGRFGTTALAGYGLGARLEYLQIPIVFGFGSALVAMVGTNVGAGRRARAERVAWIGAAMAAGVTGAIGISAALAPWAWLGLFSTDPAVLAVGGRYLVTVGPCYAFFGLGLSLYFASQGAGRLLWPLLAGLTRLLVAVGGGWYAVTQLGSGLTGVFMAAAAAFVAFGLALAVAVWTGAWGRAGTPAPRLTRTVSTSAPAEHAG
jgi:putative MATE family efflux protein